MGSLNAKAVAQEVKRNVISGYKVDLVKITQKHGYTRKSALAQKAVGTKTFKREMKSTLDWLNQEIGRIASAMGEKDLSEVEYEKLGRTYDILIKNSQLLSGKATENVRVIGQEDVDTALANLKGNDKKSAN
jgi:hypothetical protein